MVAAWSSGSLKTREMVRLAGIHVAEERAGGMVSISPMDTIRMAPPPSGTATAAYTYPATWNVLIAEAPRSAAVELFCAAPTGTGPAGSARSTTTIPSAVATIA